MNKWIFAAVAAGLSVCVVACSHGDGSSNEDEMTIPEKVNFVEPKPSKTADQDIVQFEGWYKDHATQLDLTDAIEHITRKAETDSAKEKEYQDKWSKESDKTKNLSSLIAQQIGSNDCIRNTVPAKEWKLEDFKAGNLLVSDESDSLLGPKCSVSYNATTHSVYSIKTYKSENAIPTEYSMYLRSGTHTKGTTAPGASEAANFDGGATWEGPFQYKKDSFMNWYLKGTYKVSGADGAKKGTMDCSVTMLVKSIGKDDDPAISMQYVMHCSIAMDGKTIPMDYNFTQDTKKNQKFDIYVSGKKIDMAAWAQMTSLQPNTTPPTAK